jgi:phosphoribosyl 1,2-cyclic phosphodiesterase
MRFLSLGSGSRGNATLLQSAETLLLIDCGFTLKELQRRLETVSIAATDIDAILITHEHADHVRGAPVLARRFQIPVWATSGTAKCVKWGSGVELHQFNANVGHFRIGSVDIKPFTVPHDASEPCQYAFSSQNRRFGMLTDAGSITSHILEHLDDLDSLLLECNHDPLMLQNGPYPPALQVRVAGNHGHLNNLQSCELVKQLERKNWQHLVVAHISEKNNHPDLVRSSLLNVDQTLADRLHLLQQDHTSDWFEIS